MYEIFILLLIVIGLPVFTAMVQNYLEDGGRSRKGPGRASCPPHKWILIIDDITNMRDIIICEKCGYRNKINN